MLHANGRAFRRTLKTIAVVNEHPAAAGMHRTILPKIAGVVCVRLRTQGETARYRMVVHQ